MTAYMLVNTETQKAGAFEPYPPSFSRLPFNTLVDSGSKEVKRRTRDYTAAVEG